MKNKIMNVFSENEIKEKENKIDTCHLKVDTC